MFQNAQKERTGQADRLDSHSPQDKDVLNGRHFISFMKFQYLNRWEMRQIKVRQIVEN